MTDFTEFAEDATNEMADATQRAKEKLGAGMRYVQDRSMEEMMSDVSDLIRRNPVGSLVVAASLGFLAARYLQHGTPARRYE